MAFKLKVCTFAIVVMVFLHLADPWGYFWGHALLPLDLGSKLTYSLSRLGYGLQLEEAALIELRGVWGVQQPALAPRARDPPEQCLRRDVQERTVRVEQRERFLGMLFRAFDKAGITACLAKGSALKWYRDCDPMPSNNFHGPMGNSHDESMDDIDLHVDPVTWNNVRLQAALFEGNIEDFVCGNVYDILPEFLSCNMPQILNPALYLWTHRFYTSEQSDILGLPYQVALDLNPQTTGGFNRLDIYMLYPNPEQPGFFVTDNRASDHVLHSHTGVGISEWHGIPIQVPYPIVTYIRNMYGKKWNSKPDEDHVKMLSKTKSPLHKPGFDYKVMVPPPRVVSKGSLDDLYTQFAADDPVQASLRESLDSVLFNGVLVKKTAPVGEGGFLA